MDVTRIFRELRRRHVFRVAALYAGAGWLTVQVVATVVPALHLPAWITTLVVLVAIVGFPVAVVFAWVFDVTPDGLQRTEALPEGGSADLPRARRTGRLLNAAIVLVLATAVGVLAWRQLRSVPPGTGGAHTAAAGSAPVAASSMPAKSVAVLPFANLSADPDNAYFAAGLQDEILGKLTAIGELKVISRTSSRQYPSRPANLADVGRELGVATVLEGSVQRAGNEVLVNLQLIDTATSDHVWADSYQRSLEDVFGVEVEVAEKVASALQARLTGDEEQRLAAVPTENPAAYDAYLRGLGEETGAGLSALSMQRAAGFYRQAVALDPDFALAWARLAGTESAIYFRYDHTPQRLSAAHQAVDRAVALASALGATQIALGTYLYYCERDFDKALAAYERALRLLPNSAEVLAQISYIERRQGRWNEAVARERQAVALDPRNVFLLEQSALTYVLMRRYADSRSLLDRALALSPDDSTLLALEAGVDQAEGKLDEADAILARADISPDDWNNYSIVVQQRLYRRDYAGAARILRAALARGDSLLPIARGIYADELGFAESLSGDDDAAAAAFGQARETLRAQLAGEAGDPLALAWLAQAEAGLGHADAALAAARKAAALYPEKKDAVDGPTYVEALARVQAQTGHGREAIAALRRLLALPYNGFFGLNPTPVLLRLDPVWNPLRGDPAFAALLATGAAGGATLD